MQVDEDLLSQVPKGTLTPGLGGHDVGSEMPGSIRGIRTFAHDSDFVADLLIREPRHIAESESNGRRFNSERLVHHGHVY